MNKILTGNNVEILRGFDAESVDLTVTSPPYDNLRNYKGYEFDFEGLAGELYRVTKPGGIVVWIVGDATVKGDETGTSFKQALFFKEIGFNLHDTMIFAKKVAPFYNPNSLRYKQAFEYMFVLSKGRVKTYNPINDRPSVQAGKTVKFISGRGPTDRERYKNYEVISDYQVRYNIWEYLTSSHCTKDKVAFEHPAIFPEQLAEDHILSWSNPGDSVLDPFGGSGTTAKMALKTGRNFIHIDISEEYNEIARQRIEALEVE